MNPIIEELIDAALVDGELSDKERAVILKKADSLGEDPDEVEIVMEAKLAQVRKQPSGSVLRKQGIVKKCPHCGATLGALATSCKECGHELTEIEASATIKAIREEFRAIDRETEKLGAITDKRRTQAIKARRSSAIRDFVVPQSREELQQLILFIKPKLVEGAGSDSNIDDWRAKFSEILGRARSAYKDDQKTIAELDAIESSAKVTGSATALNAIRRNPVKTGVAILLLISIVFGYIEMQEQKAKLAQCEVKYAQGAATEKTRLTQVFDKANKEFLEKNYQVALSSAAQIKWEYADECKQEENVKSRASWDEKKKELVALIQKNADADAAEKKDVADRLARESEEANRAKFAKEQAEIAERKAEADRLARANEEAIRAKVAKEQAEAQAVAPQKSAKTKKSDTDSAAQIFGAILKAASQADKQK